MLSVTQAPNSQQAIVYGNHLLIAINQYFQVNVKYFWSNFTVLQSWLF